MVNYVCIGKGTTDENGVAHITHDCNGNPLSEPGYKGSGAGETLIVASLDKPVVSESVISNVLPISDVDNYSLILTADKSIIQSSETSVLSATLKNNNIPLAGKTVEFTSEKVLKTLVGNGQTGSYGYLDDDYYLTVDDNCNYVAIGSSSGNWLKITPSTIFLNGDSPSYVYDNDYPIHVKNGILTYVDGNGDSQTVDVSNYNPLKALWFQTGCTFRWYSLYGVTDSTGVASVPYVGTGAGLQSVTAKYGTIVSEPCTVLDCLFYDDGVTDPKTTSWWDNSNGSLNVSIDSTGTLLSNSTSSHIQYFANKNGSSGGSYANIKDYSDEVVVEFDIVSYTDFFGIVAYGDNNRVSWSDELTPSVPSSFNLKVHITDDRINWYVDKEIDGNPTNYWNISGGLGTNYGVGIVVGKSGKSVKYKNFKVTQYNE